jgi:hypothetical protein
VHPGIHGGKGAGDVLGYNPLSKGLSWKPRMNVIGFINCYLDRNHTAPVKITLHYYFLGLRGYLRGLCEKVLIL